MISILQIIENQNFDSEKPLQNYKFHFNWIRLAQYSVIAVVLASLI